MIITFFTITIGGSKEDKGTKIPEGWKHWYLDVGNHLVIREEYYREIKELLGEKDNVELAFSWERMLAKMDFVSRVERISKEYWEQKEKDAILAQKLDDLRKDPEYLRRVEAASGNMDEMMAVLKEYGAEIDWFELKQFGLRQHGLI